MTFIGNDFKEKSGVAQHPTHDSRRNRTLTRAMDRDIIRNSLKLRISSMVSTYR